MEFGNAHMVYLLWLVPALVLFYFRAFKKREKDLEAFAHKDLLPELLDSVDTGKRKLKASLVVASVLFIVLALLRPQWGFHWEEVTRSGLDILIAVDTSKSMLAEDIKPNRLKRSVLAIKDLITKLDGDRIGLIAFAGSAFMQCPLTVDYGGFVLSLDNLDVNTIPKGGTSISSAIKTALDGYEGGRKKYKVLVLITDGEYHEGDPLKTAEKAKKEGIKIFCIGIGTKEGELIPVVDEKGGRAFLKDGRGNVVKTRLDETTLQKIALTTGGSYVRSTAAQFGLDLIYEEKLSKMEKREIENKMVKRYKERYWIPLATALVLLCIEPFIGERRKNR